MDKAKEYIRNIKVPRGVYLPDLIDEYNRIGQRFIPWGRDNLQPNRTLNAVANAPTASGSSASYSDFIEGQGFLENGDIIVNREGHTLNDILEFAAIQRSIFGGFAVHFNYNLLGQINEIQMVKMHLVRVGRELKTVIIQDWDLRQGTFLDNEFPIHGTAKLSDLVEAAGGFSKFKGTVYFKPGNMDLYPSLFSDSAILSFEFEKDVQLTSLSFIKNGMKSSGVLKLPSQTNASENDVKDQQELEKLHEPGTAGSIISLTMPLNAEGDFSNTNLFESFDLPSIDKMFTNQVKTAKDFILSAYNMPEILLGISSKGMFNDASFSEAFTYFNGKTQKPRAKMEREFNSFMGDTVWDISDLEIIPLSLSSFVKISEPVEPVEPIGKSIKNVKAIQKFFNIFK